MKDKFLSSRMKAYDLAVILMVAQVMLDKITYIEGDMLSKLFTVASLGIFLLVIFLENRYTLVQTIVIAVVGIITVYSGIRMSEYFLVMTLILSLASLEKDTERTILLMHRTKMFFVVISVAWYILFEIIPGNEPLTILTGQHNDHKFGFSHANAFALIVTWMIFERVYLYFDKIKTRHIVAVAFSGPLVFYLTACDTAMYVLVFATIVLALGRVRVIEKLIGFGAKIVFPVMAVINALFIYLYADGTSRIHEFLLDLDKALSARIREAAQLYSIYDATLFGQSVDLGGEVPYDSYYRITTLICDGLFSYLFVCFGFASTIILTVMIYYTAKKGSKRDWIMIFIYTMYAIIESHGLNAYLAFPILLYQCNFFKSFNKIDKGKTDTINVREREVLSDG